MITGLLLLIGLLVTLLGFAGIVAITAVTIADVLIGLYFIGWIIMHLIT